MNRKELDLWKTLTCVVACTALGCSQTESSSQVQSATAVSERQPFLVRRAAFTTRLTSPGPSPQQWQQETPPEFIREVLYQSGDLQLKAWLYVPTDEENAKHPALVFFHGGFAFGASDMLDCKPFIEAGFVVMTPWLRGENGLPGNFEMFYGELDDAVASIKWLSKQPYVDTGRIYTFGHSSGGVLSALLSLVDDVPIRHGGSVGGLYGTDLFDFLETPFDRTNPAERELRVLPGNIAWMKRKHYAYIGVEDEGVLGGVKVAREEMSGKESNLETIMLPGDHFSSYSVAMQKYLDLIKGNR